MAITVTKLNFTDPNGGQWTISIDSDGVLTVDPGWSGTAPYFPPTVPGLSQSAYDIVKSALRALGVKDPGEDLSAAQGQDGLAALNQMIDAWQIDRLSIFTVNISDFPFIVGNQAYTVGPGGTFAMARPAQIERLSVVLAGSGIELPIRYSLDESEWQSVLMKTVGTTYPWFCYDAGDFPLRTLNFWPIPRQANTCRLYSWAGLTQFADLDTEYQFPPGYAEAIRFNLALRLAPDYTVEPSAMVMKLALEGKARIASKNVEIGKLKCDEFITYATNTGYTGSDIPPVY